MIITGIGSRSTPARILKIFEEFGAKAKELGWFIRSGHASGADYAFEKGAKKHCIAYLPWHGFNSEDPLLATSYVSPYPISWVIDILKKYRPNHFSNSIGVQKLMHRNVFQLFGIENKQHSNVVIAYTNNGLPVGGTGLNLRIAKDYNIPIINLGSNELSVEDLISKVLLIGDN